MQMVGILAAMKRLVSPDTLKKLKDSGWTRVCAS